MGVKVKDLAAALNLSQATVSLVLNNKPGASEETRQKVFETAKLMGYDKAFSKSGLPTEVIQFVIYKKEGYGGGDASFFSKVTEGIDEQARANGYNLMITYVNETESIEEKLAPLKNNKCQGILLLATELDAAHLTPFIEVNTPLVVLDSYFENMPLDSVVINNVQGAFEATKYLASHGHKKIGYLCGKSRINNFSERHEGYNKALKKCSLQKYPEFRMELCPTVDGAYADMKFYLQQGCDLPTAFFADNDIIAVGAIKALKEFGYRIPEDISIIGFDDVPLCEMLDPPLTTVCVPKQRMGILAVDRLVDKIKNKCGEFIKIEVGTSLRERSSVCELKLSDF